MPASLSTSIKLPPVSSLSLTNEAEAETEAEAEAGLVWAAPALITGKSLQMDRCASALGEEEEEVAVEEAVEEVAEEVAEAAAEAAADAAAEAGS
jgi:hypothetical protein